MVSNLVDKKVIVEKLGISKDTVKSFTDKLGISKGKLDSMIREKQIPFIQMGKVIRFDETDVMNSIKNYQMLEYFFKKFDSQLSKDTIKTIFELLNSVKKHIPYKDDFEDVFEKYCNLEILKKQYSLDKIELENNIRNIKKSQHNIINQSVIDKRNKGELYNYLRNMGGEELRLLNELVDIGSEYKIISDQQYWEDKRKRGNRKGVKSLSIGGSDYDLNQQL